MFKDQNPGHWKLLFFYYNPEQPRLWVRRRWAWGLTLNFANPMSWAVIAVILTIPVIGAIIEQVHLIH